MFLFNKYRRDPQLPDGAGPKYSYDTGASVQLFNSQAIKDASTIIICEGEFDAMVLEANGFPAVTSTGGATSFQEEWAALFVDKEVYVCLDRDRAGNTGIIKITGFIPHAKVIPLPADLGSKFDITDFFKNHDIDDFRQLMAIAYVVERPPEVKHKKRGKMKGEGLIAAKRVPLKRYLKINHSGFAKCPYHNEKTPSLKVYSDNRWHCFGCSKDGDVVDIVMVQFEMTIQQAVEKIISEN